MRILLLFVLSFSSFGSGIGLNSWKFVSIPVSEQLPGDTLAEKRAVIPDSANYIAYASLLSI